MPKKRLDQGIPLTVIAQHANGELHQNVARPAKGICPLDQPVDNELTFTREKKLARLTYILKKIDEDLSVILVPAVIAPAQLPKKFNYIVCQDPLSSLLNLVPLFFEHDPRNFGISPKADIHDSARLGNNVSVGAFTSIAANVLVGNDTTIFPQVTIYPNSIIGERCTIHAGAVIRENCVLGSDCIVQPGAVIGADGFGYIPDAQIGLRPVPQIGHVELGERVDLGANACIDRATFGVTRVGQGSKLDNLVQVGHNVQIGRSSIVCGQAGIAGSCQIGNNVVLGGSVGVGDHLKIADNIRVGGKAGVTGDLTSPGDYGGFPAIEAKRWRRQIASLARLARKGLKSA